MKSCIYFYFYIYIFTVYSWHFCFFSIQYSVLRCSLTSVLVKLAASERLEMEFIFLPKIHYNSDYKSVTSCASARCRCSRLACLWIRMCPPTLHTLWQPQVRMKASCVSLAGKTVNYIRGLLCFVLFFHSHHGDIYRHHWDIFKPGVVTVQLQVSALAQLGNDAQHWRGDTGRRREKKIIQAVILRLQVPGL